MKIHIKNNKEIKKIIISSFLVIKTLNFIKKYIKRGVSTKKINDICHYYIIKKLKAIPSPLNYKGYQKSICTSINDEVCHGIPNNQIIDNDNIINIDITINKNDYHSDSSKMFKIGALNKDTEKLLFISQQSLYKTIKNIKPKININQIGYIIEEYIKKYNFTSVKEYCGHGIGYSFHEEPQILHYKNNQNMYLKSNMIFTIEPMINLGERYIKISDNKWTIKTKDQSKSSQWEHTILVTENGYKILTLRQDEKI